VHLQQQRWQRIALEASQQSERWDVPTVSLPCSTAEFFRNHEGTSAKLILSERRSGESLEHVSLPSTAGTGIAVAVGPEGGWEQQEITAAVRHGFVPVTLGSRILRADTAALAALAIIQSRLGGLG
jgi:16S rRNA (uracil1498-N3)-methyltransferase